MFHTAMILFAGVIWTLASGMYTESIGERMANLEDALTHQEKALAHFSRIVKENDNTLHDLLTALLMQHAAKTTKRQLNLEGIIDDDKHAELSQIFRNISIEDMKSLLRGKDGLPGEPGPAGPPGVCSKSQCTGLKQPSYSTYWDQEDIHSYLRVTNLPPLTELTACFYFEPSHDDPLDALRDNEHDNAFLVRLYKLNGQGVMDLVGETAQFTQSLEAFDSAHRHCFVWKKNDNLKWFYDTRQPGVLELAGTVPSTTDHPVTSGSALVLLHDQDIVGGALDANQMIRGKIADFQMWDRALSDKEVRSLGCEAKGSLVTFDDFDAVGLGKFKQGGNFECYAARDFY